MNISIEQINKDGDNWLRFKAEIENGDGKYIDLKLPFELEEFEITTNMFIRKAKELQK